MKVARSTIAATIRFTLSSLLLLSAVSAQNKESSSTTSAPSKSSTAASTSSDGPITHTVQVAKGGFTFVPDVVLAKKGDVIEFDFFPDNHSVVRAEYGYPCIPYEDTGVDKIGFFSGFHPVDTILPDPPKWTLTINDTDPVFYYCSAPGSCINYGMVGVVNPNATHTLAVQKQLARNSSFMLQPGEPWPSESTPDPFSTSAGSVPTSTSSSWPSSSSSSSSSGGHSGLSGGAIAGIAIGAAAVALIAASLLYLCGRQSVRDRFHHRGPFDNRQSYGSQPPMMAHPQHMSGMTYSSRGDHDQFGQPSPGLPGYMQHQTMSPNMQPQYPPSDVFSQNGMGSPGLPRSPSPSQMTGPTVPAYSAVPTENTIHEQPKGPHELYAPTEGPEGGIRGFFKRGSSTKKSGGAERYS
ncbi:MAG: hypothetical protein Q9227_001621 [Pyrenula ochraceoflavens]